MKTSKFYSRLEWSIFWAILSVLPFLIITLQGIDNQSLVEMSDNLIGGLVVLAYLPILFTGMLIGFLFALIHLILALLSIVRKECPRGIRIAHCAILLGNLLGIIIPLFIFST